MTTHLEQNLEQPVGFFLLESDYTLGETWLDKQRLLSGGLIIIQYDGMACAIRRWFYRMDPDNGMLTLHRLPSHMPAISTRLFCLRVSAMLGA